MIDIHGRHHQPGVRFRLMALIVLWTASSFPLLGAENDWGEPVKDRDGITVYTRPVPDSPVRAFRGEVLLDARLDTVLALLNDIPASTEWLHQCMEARALEEVAFDDRYLYQVNNMPFPVKDRDYIFHATLAMHGDKQGVILRLESEPDYLPETRNVRIRVASGFYDLTRVHDEDGREQVQLIWEQHVEPAGNIPQWLVNLLLVDIPYNSLRDFRTLLARDKYRNAQLTYDSEGNITGLTLTAP